MQAWMLEGPASAAAQPITFEFDVYLTLGK